MTHTQDSDEATRPCFICGTADRRTVAVETWDVAAVGRVSVGISVCSRCGLVYQSPYAGRHMLDTYYRHYASYSNPSRACTPDPSARIRSQVERQKQYLDQVLVSHAFNASNPRVFQFGSSDGYSLSVFKNAGWEVVGLDPTEAAVNLARTSYGIEAHVGTIEDFPLRELGEFHVVLATHVLEHLVDPVAALSRVRGIVRPDGVLLIEVPVLEAPELWPNGYFTFEHLQYFSARTLSAALNKAGYRILDSRIILTGHGTSSPVICAVARKLDDVAGSVERDGVYADPGEIRSAIDKINRYHAYQESTWSRIASRIDCELRKDAHVGIYGAGIHTSQLLAHMPALLPRVEKLFDSNEAKRGEDMLGLRIYGLEDLPKAGRWDIIISSRASEAEIYRTICSVVGDDVRIIRLYHSLHEGEVR